MASYMQWHIVSRAQYDAGTAVDTDLYFITGENVIYRGTELYTKSMEFYTTLPTEPAPNRIYVDSATLEGKMWDGSAWNTVIRPLADTVAADGANPVSGKAVSDFVAAEIAKITGEGGTVLTGASYDADNHILTFATGAGDVNITLNGLGCALTYDQATGILSMLDASGNKVGSDVNLALEKFVKSGEYDADAKNIILYFDDEKTEKVEIPVGDLVDTYTVEGSNSIDLQMVSNKITAALKLSAEAGNIAELKADGLYVPTTDISGKADKDTDAVEGNIAVFDANGNPVDSGKTFEDIQSNVKVYTGASIEDAVAGNVPTAGDICIIKTQIGETGKYQHTAYVHNGTNWEAMDGNYSAESVYFPEDLTTTNAIGNIKLTNGQATIAAAGKNLKEVWNAIFVKEANPTTTQPSVSLTANQNKAYEVGTTVTPSYTATLNAGSYTYGPATGVTATAWEVTDSDGHTLTTNTGSFDALVVEDATNYTITATATYGDGAIPVTNLGNEYAAGQIKAGTKSKTSAKISGYRCGFYGTLTDTVELTSAVIRGLANKTSAAPAAGNKWSLSVPVGAKRVVFAYPATVRDVNSVLNVNGLNAEIKTGFTMVQMDVEGANNAAAIAYKVYYLDYANPNDAANTYTITL